LFGGLLLGGALVAGLAALFGGNKTEWDANVGRRRDEKGRFTKP
jgi:hypothetical protein